MSNHDNDQENETAHEIPADPSPSILDGNRSEINDQVTSENTGNGRRKEHDVTTHNAVKKHDAGGVDINESNAAQRDRRNSYERDHAIHEGGNNDNSYHYSSNDIPLKMSFDPINSSNDMMMCPNQNDITWQQHQHSQCFSPNNGPQEQTFDTSSADGSAPLNNSQFSCNPLNQQQQQPIPINGLPPMQLPPVPPPMSYSTVNNPNLDATRQYYEARMREHAMHYANAATAWAATIVACGVPNNNYAVAGMPGALPMMANNQHSSPFGHPSPINTNSNQGLALSSNVGPLQQKRSLWKPPSSLADNKNTKKERSNSYKLAKVPKKGGSKPSSMKPPKSISSISSNNNETKLPREREKRESRGGNDSVSSLGSESRDRLSVGGGNGNNRNNLNNRNIRRNNESTVGCDNNKRNGEGKKGNQRRRYNEDDTAAVASPKINIVTVNTGNGNGKCNVYHSNNKQIDNHHHRQKRGLHHGHSSKGSFSSFGSGTNNSNPHSSGGSGRNKKKNRSQQPETTRHNNSSNNTSNSTSIHLRGLIGKNGGMLFVYLSACLF